MPFRLSPPRRVQVAGRRCLLFWIVASALATVAIPAAAVEAGDTTPTSSIEVLAQDTCVDSGEPFSISLKSENRVRVRLHDRVSTRQQFTLALFETFRTRTIQKTTLSAGEDGTFQAKWTAGSSPISREGVYPVSFSEFDNSGNEVQGPVSFVCVNPETAPNAEVLVMGRIEVPPLPSPDATDRIDWNAPAAGNIVSHLAQQVRPGYFLHAGGDAIDRWAQADGEQARDGFRQLQTVAENGQLLAGPFVPIDEAALSDAGLGDAVADTTGLGTDQIRARIPAASAQSVAVIDAPTTAALRAARRQSISTVILPSASIDGGDGGSGVVRTTSGTVHVATYDQDLSPLWTSPMPTKNIVLRAHQLAAGVALATRRSEHPATMVLIDAGHAKVSRRFLNAWDSARSGLRGVTAGDLDGLIASAESNTSRAFTDQPHARSPISAVAYRAAQADLRTLAATVDPSDPLVARARRAIAYTTASGAIMNDSTYRANPFRRSAWQALPVALLHEAFEGIKLPSSTHITLPAASAKIPITVRNGTPRAIPILVRLSSPRLTFPDRRDFEWRGTLPRGGGKTLNVPVQAHSAGNTVINVQILSADARFVAKEERIRVSASLVASRIALILSGVTLFFLLIWWGSHRRKHRKAAA